MASFDNYTLSEHPSRGEILEIRRRSREWAKPSSGLDFIFGITERDSLIYGIILRRIQVLRRVDWFALKIYTKRFKRGLLIKYSHEIPHSPINLGL